MCAWYVLQTAVWMGFASVAAENKTFFWNPV